MKTLRSTFGMLLIMFSTVTASAVRMSYYEMRDNARFLTDRMMYVLNLRPELMDDLYCINFDYICGVNDYLDDVARGYRYNEYRDVLLLRDRALISLLTEVEWRMLTGYDYFYRPISFVNNVWSFSVYAFDKWNRRLFFDRPKHFDDYRGGRYFSGMDRGREMGGRAMENHNRRGDMNRGSDMRGSSNVATNASNMRGGNDTNRSGNDTNRNGSNMNRGNGMNGVGGNSATNGSNMRNNNGTNNSNGNSNRYSNTGNNNRGSFTAMSSGRTNGNMNGGMTGGSRSNVSSSRGGSTRSNVSRGGGRR